MIVLLALSALAFTVSLLLTPLVRDAAQRWQLVDHPDQVRKLHEYPIPRLGGVAIFLAYASVLCVFRLLPQNWSSAWISTAPFSWLTIGAVLIVFATGVIDDLVGLRAP